jgi:hypothetical protein
MSFVLVVGLMMLLFSCVMLAAAVMLHTQSHARLKEVRALHEEAMHAIECHERWMERIEKGVLAKPGLVLAFPAPARVQ